MKNHPQTHSLAVDRQTPSSRQICRASCGPEFRVRPMRFFCEVSPNSITTLPVQFMRLDYQSTPARARGIYRFTSLLFPPAIA